MGRRGSPKLLSPSCDSGCVAQRVAGFGFFPLSPYGQSKKKKKTKNENVFLFHLLLFFLESLPLQNNMYNCCGAKI